MIYSQSRHRRKMQEGGDTSEDEVGINPPPENDNDLAGTVKDRLAGTMPEGTSVDPTKIADQDLTGTELDYDKLGTDPSVTAEKADEAQKVTAPTAPEEGKYSYD